MIKWARSKLATDLAAVAWSLLALSFLIVVIAAGMRNSFALRAGYMSLLAGAFLGTVVLTMEEE